MACLPEVPAEQVALKFKDIFRRARGEQDGNPWFPQQPRRCTMGGRSVRTMQRSRRYSSVRSHYARRYDRLQFRLVMPRLWPGIHVATTTPARHHRLRAKVESLDRNPWPATRREAVWLFDRAFGSQRQFLFGRSRGFAGGQSPGRSGRNWLRLNRQSQSGAATAACPSSHARLARRPARGAAERESGLIMVPQKPQVRGSGMRIVERTVPDVGKSRGSISVTAQPIHAGQFGGGLPNGLEGIQSCGVHYATNATTSSPFAGGSLDSDDGRRPHQLDPPHQFRHQLTLVP
jgi:hypothetical protein